MKKVIGLLVALCVMFGVTSNAFVTVNAEEYGGYTFGIVGDAAVIVAGDSTIKGDVVIPSTLDGYPVKKIEINAFEGNETITSVVVPEGVESICDSAFQYCKNIKKVTLPSTLKEIEAWAFLNCSALSSVNLPNGLEVIGNGAFKYCENLSTITIPASVKEIGESAFSETSIKSIVLPNGLKKVDDRVFYYCEKLENVTIPASVEKICDNAFEDCPKLTTVNISEGVKKIGNEAFLDCTSLKSVVIPASVSKISSTAFLSCKNMKAAYIKGSDTQIDKHALGFYDVNRDTFDDSEYFHYFVKLKDFTIVAKKGSKAETYAKKNNLKFAEYSSAQKISSISKLKGGLKVKWKKNSTATGYKIRYSLNKNMSGAKTITISKNKTTSKKITKLKKKTKYYVQIRSYKKVNGITFYGDWSAVKSQTTK